MAVFVKRFEGSAGGHVDAKQWLSRRQILNREGSAGSYMGAKQWRMLDTAIFYICIDLCQNQW